VHARIGGIPWQLVPDGQSMSATQLSEQYRMVPAGPIAQADRDGSSEQSAGSVQAQSWQYPPKQNVPGFTSSQSALVSQFGASHRWSGRLHEGNIGSRQCIDEPQPQSLLARQIEPSS